MNPTLCLGTAQFGLPYGISNTVGQVPEDEVARILRLASSRGICWIDTAQGYGQSEAVLGRVCSPNNHLRFISKLPPQTNDNVNWDSDFKASLCRLGVSYLDAFLVHHSNDLLGPKGTSLLNWLESLQERGLVKRIGVSIYDASELKYLPLDRLQIIQLPLSLYDQRLFQDGTISHLIDRGLSIHARSVFLQGLLLQHPDQWPSFLSDAFCNHHRLFLAEIAVSGTSLLEAALCFVRKIQALEVVLVGVVNARQLVEILDAWYQANSTQQTNFDLRWAWQYQEDIDPRLWPVI